MSTHSSSRASISCFGPGTCVLLSIFGRCLPTEKREVSKPLVVLIPIYNDWTAVGLLLRELDRVAVEHRPMEVIIVDDGSTEEPGADFRAHGFREISTVVVLRLRRNLGHQRAICVGLVHVYQTHPDAVTVIMDGDGEDRPEDIPKLLSKFGTEAGRKIIFAERARRADGLLFKFFYRFYKVLHLALTGIEVRVGNFSAVPYSCLSSLVVISEMWNHYAAAVFNARLPFDTVRLSRGRRLSGSSKMKFVSLVTHGLSAISVYSDIVGVRLLTISSLTIVLLILAIIAISLSHSWYAALATAGLTIYVVGLLLLLLVQAVAISFMFVFFVLSGRSGTLFLPIRDCPFFIEEVRSVDRRTD
jgi:glycosyltransferase involved in cell wall biosynthesis